METKVAKWGNSLAVRLPKSVIEESDLRPGDRLNVSVGRKGAITLSPKQSRIPLDALLKEMKPAKGHRETDWGERRGREEW